MLNLNPLNRYSPEARDVIFTVPNVISLLRIVSIPFIAMFIAQHHMVVALILLAISSFTDALDGFIARACNQVSKIGQILDPIADRLLIFCSILALGIAQVIPLWILLIVFIRDFLLAMLTLILAQHDYGPLPVHFVGKAGTALVMSSIVVFIFSSMDSTFFLEWVGYCAAAIGIWGLALYWLAGIIYLQQGFRLIHTYDSSTHDSNTNNVPPYCSSHTSASYQMSIPLSQEGIHG